MTSDEAIKIIESIVEKRIQYGGQPDILDETLLIEIKRLRSENKRLEKRPVDFDSMTPKQVREWGEELSHCASQFNQIQDTLIENCKPGRRLDDFGIKYNESKPILFNLIHILETLIEKIEHK